jgi:hypothetical protein
MECDANNYIIGDVVKITANGFEPSCRVLMVINIPDSDPIFETVLADADGAFVWAYRIAAAVSSIQAATLDQTVSLATTSFVVGPYLVANSDHDPGNPLVGDTITLSGRGFTPGESVALHIVDEYPGGNPDRDYSATADGAGAISNTDLVALPGDLNHSLSATATGATSGLVVQAFFAIG